MSGAEAAEPARAAQAGDLWVRDAEASLRVYRDAIGLA